MSKVAQSAGFCFGVNRSIELLNKAIATGKKVSTFGPIIHNKTVVDEYAAKGVSIIDDVSEVQDGGIVVIRSHGIPKEIHEQLSEKNIEIYDATCPFVSRIHGMARRADEENRHLIVIGTKNHPEVEGICSFAQNVTVAQDVDELADIVEKETEITQKPLTVVAQTTLNIENWENCGKYLKKMCTKPEIFDTICGATFERQIEAAAIAQESDIMIVLGGADSSNTKKLYEICKSKCMHTYQALDCSELPIDEIKELIKNEGLLKIGITAGASTPANVIKEAKIKMDELAKSFEEALEESLITLTTGDRVRGIVIGFTPTEVLVDLGTKQAAYIPASEVSTDPNVDPSDVLKVGDEIEVFVTRVNDVDGYIYLSKKKVDSLKGIEALQKAYEDGTLLEGKIEEVVKGGVILFTNGARVFIPASQCPVRMGEDLQPLVGTTQTFKIIDFERRRNKIVGSINAPIREARKAAAEKFWAEAEVDKRYTGVVKSLTNYGAFVDLGGVDGMVHINELAWSKIKHPSIVCKVGDEIDVYIKEMDREKNRISLGYKELTENPWKVLEANYHVGDVVTVKIARIVPFGAFAELIPGVDALIHISQIANKRIENPANELSVGQEVDAKITNIDIENQRVSLSIRALLEPEKPAAPAEEEVATLEETEAPVEEETVAPVEEAPVEEEAAPAEETAPVEEAPAEEVTE